MKKMLALAAILILPLTASAHELAKGPNGGPVVDSDGHHVELVADGSALVLFLTEGADDTPLPSAGTTNARAVVQVAGKTAIVQLAPAEPNKLVGTLAQPLGTDAKVVVSATLADGHTVQARFGSQ
jgi:hypothetical protein